jgi:hypothetical protein
MFNMLRKREPGESPGLSRSGMQERPPSRALVLESSKDWEATAIRSTTPARLRVRRPAGCAGRAASGGLIASWNGRLTVTVSGKCLKKIRRARRDGFGFASAGGDQTVDQRTKT